MTSLAAGVASTCVVALVDEAAYCWGEGILGRLGDGSMTSRTTSVAVATGDGSALLAGAEVTAIAVGGSHACAIAGAAAYCWGDGNSGRLGNEASTNQFRPVAVLEPTMS